MDNENPDIEKQREELIQLYQTKFSDIVEPVKTSIKAYESTIPVIEFSTRIEIRN